MKKSKTPGKKGVRRTTVPGRAELEVCHHPQGDLRHLGNIGPRSRARGVENMSNWGGGDASITGDT